MALGDAVGLFGVVLAPLELVQFLVDVPVKNLGLNVVVVLGFAVVRARPVDPFRLHFPQLYLFELGESQGLFGLVSFAFRSRRVPGPLFQVLAAVLQPLNVSVGSPGDLGRVMILLSRQLLLGFATVHRYFASFGLRIR